MLDLCDLSEGTSSLALVPFRKIVRERTRDFLLCVDNQLKLVIKEDGAITPLLLPILLGLNHGGVTGSPTARVHVRG